MAQEGTRLAMDDVASGRSHDVKRCPDCELRFGAETAFCPFDGTRLLAGSWDPSGDALLGTVVDGRYEVCAVLGEGGMGTVYKVRHTTLNRYFAMKVLRKDLARESDLSARFIQEAHATASIKHPSVVAVTDFGQLGHETPYFVMELLSGRPLSEAIKAAGVLDPTLAVKIILKIAAALGAAHDAGVIHRDLKPENIFLMAPVAGPGNNDDDVRIVDFGAAKVMGARRLTKAGIVFGTPHYMSPEQASGDEVDLRTDIYALGVIMYEMFTGRVPFEADTYMGVLTQHMFVNPAPPSQLAPAHAKELGALEAVTLRALEKKPSARFASMHELRREVERVVRFEEGGQLRVSSAGITVKVRSKRPPPPVPKSFAFPVSPEVDRLVSNGNGDFRRRLGGLALGFGVLAAGALGVVGWSRWARPTASPDSLLSVPRAVSAPQLSVPLASAAAALAELRPRTVEISSAPSAEIWLDGARVGTTPMALVVDSGAATSRVVLRCPGYEDTEVTLDADTRPSLFLELRKGPTSVRPSPSVVSTAPSGVPHVTRRPSAHQSGAPLGSDFSDPWKK